MPGPKDAPFNKQLLCRLTDSEVLRKGEALAAARLLIEELKDQRKAVNERINAQQDEVLKLAQLIDARSEERDVPCKWVEDFTHKVRKLIRQDTGEEVESAIMTADDLQDELDLDDGDEEFNDLDDTPLRSNVDDEPEHLDA